LFWIKNILFLTASSLIDCIEKYKEKKYGYDFEREIWYQNLKEKLEYYYQLPRNLASKSKIKIFNLLPEDIRRIYSNNKELFNWFLGSVIIFSVWFNYNDPFNDFMLVTKGVSVNGFITESEEESELVEYNDGRSFRQEHSYRYTYSYITKENNRYFSQEVVKGVQPQRFSYLDESPLQVSVTYLETNPKYSRVFKYTDNNTSLFDWLKSTFLFLVLFQFVWAYFIYLSLKK
jgi:hypothetical protein